jgi:uncharacterized tellurite resistance protein B-like protein
MAMRSDGATQNRREVDRREALRYRAAMDLSGLGPEEKLALVALLKTCLAADGEISEGEGAELDEVIAALGDEEYSRLADEADRRFQEESDLRAFLESISGQEARETIFGILLDATTGEAIRGRDLELVEWLEETWGVQVKTLPEGE